MPIQYLFKHDFLPLARETFTFKFSNIPQSLIRKQHMSVLQLLPSSEAVGITPSHAGRRRRERLQGAAAATGQRSPRRRRCARRAVPAGGERGARDPPAPHPAPGKGRPFRLGSTLKATEKLHRREGPWGAAPGPGIKPRQRLCRATPRPSARLHPGSAPGRSRVSREMTAVAAGLPRRRAAWTSRSATRWARSRSHTGTRSFLRPSLPDTRPPPTPPPAPGRGKRSLP